MPSIISSNWHDFGIMLWLFSPLVKELELLTLGLSSPFIHLTNIFSLFYWLVENTFFNILMPTKKKHGDVDFVN